MLREQALIRVLTIRRSDLEQVRMIASGNWEWNHGLVLRTTSRGGRAVCDPVGWYVKTQGQPAVYLLAQDRGSGNLWKMEVPDALRQRVMRLPQLFVR